MYIRRHLIYGFSFVVLFSVAVWCLELIEGYKITTSEYYGLRNIGFMFIMIMTLMASVFYPVFLLPLSIVISRFVSGVSIRVLLYSILGGIGGTLIFHKLYSHNFIQEYNLNSTNSIIIFGLVGFIYALIDNDLKRRTYKHPTQKGNPI